MPKKLSTFLFISPKVRIESVFSGMQFTQLQTERLTLRLINPQVWHYAFGQLNEAQICTLLQFNNPAEFQKASEQYQNGIESWWFSFAWFQIFRKSDNKYLGWCGYHTWVLNHHRAEIGYVLTAEEERRKGYMGEALKEILRYGFETMQLNRIEALTGDWNETSQHMLKTNGFVYEGRLRAHYFKDTGVEDSLMFGLLKSDFEQSNA